MPHVNSSAVASLEYDGEAANLVVTFRGGARYAYAGVSRATYDKLLASDSIGRFVNTIIKPNYAATRLNDQPSRAAAHVRQSDKTITLPV